MIIGVKANKLGPQIKCVKASPGNALNLLKQCYTLSGKLILQKLELYLNFGIQQASQPAIRSGYATCRFPEILMICSNHVRFMNLLSC